MKAIRVHQTGEPEVMRLEEVPTPTPGTGEVLVRIHAIGVNPVETYIRSGKYVPPPLPYTPGTDAAGVVEAVGPEVKSVSQGDRVYTAGSITGTYAEFCLCKENQVHRLPASVSFEAGAALGIPYGTAYRALFQRGHAEPGEWVLIHGASGGVGTAATQLAHAHGLRIIGTAGTEKGRDLVKGQGAHFVLDHSDPTYLAKISELTQGQGVDLIIEMLANANLGKDLTVLANGGRVVVVGSRGKVEIDPRETMRREAAIFGLMLAMASPRQMASIHFALRTGLEIGTIKPIIGRRIPFAEAPRAHKEILEPGSYGKIILIP